METFCEKVYLIIIDKVLLAAAGGLIAYFYSMALERYKRNQSVILELGKLRAQAFAHILSALTHHHSLVEKFLRIDRNPEGQVEYEKTKLKAEESNKRLLGIINDEIGLLDEKTYDLFMDYVSEIADIDYDMLRRGPLPQQILDERHDKILALRRRLAVHMPPLPTAD